MQDFYAIGYHRLVAVGEGMAVDALILGMAIDENEQLARAA